MAHLAFIQLNCSESGTPQTIPPVELEACDVIQAVSGVRHTISSAVPSTSWRTQKLDLQTEKP